MTLNVAVNVSGTIVHELRLPPGVCPGGVTVADLEALEKRIMSLLSDKLDTVSNSLDAAIGRVQEDVSALQREIDDLKRTAVTPADLERLDALQAKLDAIDPVKPATLPPA